MIQLARLLGSVLLEGLVGAGHTILFLFQRRSTRAWIRSLLAESRAGSLGRGSEGKRADKVPAGAGVPGGRLGLAGLAGLLAAGLLSGGCASSPLEQQRQFGSPVPGTSFERQISEFGDSAAMIANMSDAQGSLEDDLRSFGSGTSVSEAAGDLETLLLDPGSQRSLEDDLREFGKSDPKSFWETLLMLGW